MTVFSIKSITEVEKADWEPLVPSSFPFARYEFLLALETTNCLGQRTGWFPVHQIAVKEGRPQAALLLFLKTNSYGEYIFDFAWANAFESSGLNYYPKLVSAIPFTPATGPKLLLAPWLSELERKTITRELLEKTLQVAAETEASTVHHLFIPPAHLNDFETDAFTARHSYQFHWRNENYSNFSDFLGRLKSKRRKEILRERNQAAKSGVKISRLTGSELHVEHADLMFSFYSDTVRKMGAYPYLTREFYRAVFKSLNDQILFVLAEDGDGQAVAGALNYFGSDTLFGRSWGCLDEFKALHFELCYYQGIEFAIERKLTLFEAGAQGEHKLQRGFLPTLTHSTHAVREPGFKIAIDSFIEAEKKELQYLLSAYDAHSPFAQKT